jgi:DNA-binding beta-propeller fold protein YncE
MALDPDGNLYVVDAVFSNFQVFALDGQVLTFVGRGGVAKGHFQVPSGIAIGKDGAIYVADEMNGRIQRFQYISLPPPPARTPAGPPR